MHKSDYACTSQTMHAQVRLSMHNYPTYASLCNPYTRDLCLDFQMLYHFHSLQKLHHVTESHPFPCDKPPEHERRVRKTQESIKNGHMNSIIYILYTPGSLLLSNICSLLSRLHCHPPAARTHLCPIHPSIQPNFSLPCTHPKLTSIMDTLLAIWYSSILCMSLNQCFSNLSGLLPPFPLNPPPSPPKNIS